MRHLSPLLSFSFLPYYAQNCSLVFPLTQKVSTTITTAFLPPFLDTVNFENHFFLFNPVFISYYNAFFQLIVPSIPPEFSALIWLCLACKAGCPQANHASDLAVWLWERFNESRIPGSMWSYPPRERRVPKPGGHWLPSFWQGQRLNCDSQLSHYRGYEAPGVPLHFLRQRQSSWVAQEHLISWRVRLRVLNNDWSALQDAVFYQPSGQGHCEGRWSRFSVQKWCLKRLVALHIPPGSILNAEYLTPQSDRKYPAPATRCWSTTVFWARNIRSTTRPALLQRNDLNHCKATLQWVSIRLGPTGELILASEVV